jgi:FkbM family methyltransferase
MVVASIMKLARDTKENLLASGTLPALLENVIGYFFGEPLYFLYPRLGINESNESKVLRFIIKQEHLRGKVAFDIGSCRGMYALRFAKDFSKVYAFEPETRNFEILQLNIKLRHKNNIQPLRIAVSDKSGKAKLYTAKSKFNHSLISKAAESTTYEYVEIVSLDDFVKEPVDLVKVDTQNKSLDIVKGSTKVMPKIDRWIIELEENELDKKSELEALMKSYGYKTKWLTEQHLYASKNN